MYSLKYFNGRGVVEPTRVLFAIAGVQFEDQRLSIDPVTYARPEFEEEKAKGLFEINMDRLPILVYDGVQIGQSKTIERFVAKQLGLMGSSNIEEALIDMITEHIRDIKQKYMDSKSGKTGDDLEKAKSDYLANELPKWMEKLEKCLGSSGFAVGSKLSLADVVIQQFIQDFFDDKVAAAKAIESCPKVTNSVNLVAEAAKTYFETRPVTLF